MPAVRADYNSYTKYEYLLKKKSTSTGGRSVRAVQYNNNNVNASFKKYNAVMYLYLTDANGQTCLKTNI